MEHTIENQTKTMITKPRKVFIAFLLSLLFPGLGQVYNGQLKKAIILFCLLLIYPLLFGLTRGTTYFYGLILLFIIEIAFRLYLIIDAVMNAKRQKEYILKPYNTWYYHLLIAILIQTILMMYNSNILLGTRTYKIPSTSNEPTLLVGDNIVADMKAYDVKEPDYGDIVVFSKPDGQNFVFRVIGRPNDKVELVDDIACINGNLCKSTYIRETTNDGTIVDEYEEELPNGHKHLIYKFKAPFIGPKSNIKDIIVPPDCYYLLGDNRDIAADSRNIGFVNKQRIEGRIMYCYWGTMRKKRINIDFKDK